MLLNLTVYTTFCATGTFVINNIKADSDDFGSQEDRSPENAEDYGCGAMTFTRKESSSEILAKYNISEGEYAEVCDKLEKGLSFGCCGWCV